MFPEVPVDLSALTIEALRQLTKDIPAAARRLRAEAAERGGLTAEETAAGVVARDNLNRVKAELAERTRLQAEHEAGAEAIEDLADADDVDPEEGDEDGDGEEDGEEDLAVEEEDAGDGEGEEEVVAAGSAPKHQLAPIKVGSVGPRRTKAAAPVAEAPRPLVSALVAADDTALADRGQPFASWSDFSSALLEVGRTIDPKTSNRYTVARIEGQYPEHRRLESDPLFNLQLFELGDPKGELTAAMCAPCTPYYGLTGLNTDRRPVFNSLPQFAAPRGCVSIYPSPSLSDIDAGTGIWTNTEDSNPAATKNACQTIECATPEEYRIYGVYRCLTVKNLLALTYPELVEAYLNRLAAAYARLAEKQLLDAMGTEATALSVDPQGYNATVSLTSALLTYLGLYQEIERWDVPGMEVWLPRWVQWALKMDQVRRRNTTGEILSIPSDAQINRLFTDQGITPHWFMDTPTWADPVPAVASNGVLNLFPNNIDMLVAPTGKFAIMDRGELRIGVTGNNIYRDNTSNSRNEFTFFFENFEGIVNTNNMPAHRLTLPVCFNGVQIDDRVIDCTGHDYTGDAIS